MTPNLYFLSALMILDNFLDLKFTFNWNSLASVMLDASPKG